MSESKKDFLAWALIGVGATVLIVAAIALMLLLPVFGNLYGDVMPHYVAPDYVDSCDFADSSRIAVESYLADSAVTSAYADSCRIGLFADSTRTSAFADSARISAFADSTRTGAFADSTRAAAFSDSSRIANFADSSRAAPLGDLGYGDTFTIFGDGNNAQLYVVDDSMKLIADNMDVLEIITQGGIRSLRLSGPALISRSLQVDDSLHIGNGLVIDSMGTSQIVLRDGTGYPEMSLWNYFNVGGYNGGELAYNSTYHGTNWIRQNDTLSAYCLYFNPVSSTYEIWIEGPDADTIVTWTAADFVFDTFGVISCNGATFDGLTLANSDSIVTIDGAGNLHYVPADSLGGGTSYVLYAENPVSATAPTAAGNNSFAIGSKCDVGNSNSVAIGYDCDSDASSSSVFTCGRFCDLTKCSNGTSIMGGYSNSITSTGIYTCDHNVIVGGTSNSISQSSSAGTRYSAIIGGGSNTISCSSGGSQYSYIMGNSCSITNADYNFAFGNNVDISTTDYHTAFYDSINPGYFTINMSDSKVPTSALEVGGGIKGDSLSISGGDFLSGFYVAGDSLFFVVGVDTMKVIKD